MGFMDLLIVICDGYHFNLFFATIYEYGSIFAVEKYKIAKVAHPFLHLKKRKSQMIV
jgi:hypothetical protein